MEEFVNSNPGLRSRFNKYVNFADYTAEEMIGIFRLNCKKAYYVLDEDAEKEVAEYFTAAAEEAGEFGNARGVRNTFEKILTEQANRIAEMETITREELMRITLADVKAALYPTAEEKPGEESAEAGEAAEANAPAEPKAADEPDESDKPDGTDGTDASDGRDGGPNE